MLDRKVNEFQMAFKKFVTRLLILAAIVVFGAIAIAQAPKGDSETATELVTQSLTEASKPLTSTASDGNLSTVSYDQQVDDAASPTGTFSEMEPIKSTPNDQDLTTDSSYGDPSDSDDLMVDPEVQPADTSEELGYDDIGLPPASGGTDDYQFGDDQVGADYEEPHESPPELLDPNPTVEEPRENPYRSGSADDELSPYQEDDFGETDQDLYGDAGYEDELPSVNDDIVEDDTSLAPLQSDYGQEDFNETDPGLLPPPDERELPRTADSSLSIEDQNGLELRDQDPPEYTNDLRQRNAQPARFSREQDGARDFGRTEQIDKNPLPRQYAIARKNNHSITGGQPGPQNLEGPQTPSLTIEKIAPTEVQVGKPTQFQIKVRNVGQVPADNVIIRDVVPEKTRLISSSPESQGPSEFELLWDVGTINPSDESIVTIELEPTDEGQIGSIATVSFEASATARARSTKPSLAIEHTAPRQVLVGEPVKFTIKLTNPGSGTATHVVLDEDVPQGLSHSSGPKLEYEVGTILPGQTRHLELTLTASQPGPVTNVLIARGDAGLIAKDTIELEVVAPELQVKIDGPSRRYLERGATFTVSVANPGTATAKNVELVAQLPRGLKFMSTNNQGHYDQSRHAVIWNLEQLPAGEMGKAQFKAVPTEMGDFDVRAEAHADRNLAANENHKIRVEGIAALYFGVADKVDPVEVGGETTYVINVENQGSKTATNIRFRAQVPAGMQPIQGRGATRAQINGQLVSFDPIVKLPPKAKTSFEIIVRGTQPGDQKLRVEMVSGEIQTPVIKEESTRVYSD